MFLESYYTKKQVYSTISKKEFHTEEHIVHNIVEHKPPLSQNVDQGQVNYNDTKFKNRRQIQPKPVTNESLGLPKNSFFVWKVKPFL